MKALGIGFLAFFALVVSARAFTNEFGNLPQVKEISRGQPKDIVALIERIAECNHWSDEEPYDKERAEQIRNAVQKARCGSLESEKQTIGRKYKKHAKVLEAIRKATELIP